MTASFVVYIDESGDEGFQFQKGSSEWFIISAAITRKSSDLATVKLVDRVRETLDRKDREPLHFRQLKHEQKLPYIHQIAQANLRSVSVFVHKPSIRDVEKFQQRNRLYFYASRLLLERVSWYCRDEFAIHDEGDRTAEIIFSNRGGVKYEEFRAYMAELQARSGPFEVEVDWNVIKPDQITAYPSKRMGLQLADAIASGFFFGVETRYGFTEDRYARMLKPIVYSHRGRFKGYGIKFWPAETDSLLKTKSHLTWLSESYGF
jgi:hypothetical protein